MSELKIWGPSKDPSGIPVLTGSFSDSYPLTIVEQKRYLRILLYQKIIARILLSRIWKKRLTFYVPKYHKRLLKFLYQKTHKQAIKVEEFLLIG